MDPNLHNLTYQPRQPPKEVDPPRQRIDVAVLLPSRVYANLHSHSASGAEEERLNAQDILKNNRVALDVSKQTILASL